MTRNAPYVAPGEVILEQKNVAKGKNVFDYVYVCGMNFLCLPAPGSAMTHDLYLIL